MSMLRDIGESIGAAVLDGIGRAASQLQERRPLAVDLLESDDAYLAVFDAPGAEAADVQVRYEEDAVRVRIDRFREFFEGYEMRLPGRGMSLDGRATLPEGALVDPEGATATLTDHGTLRVELPKVEDEEGRAVEIATDEENGTEVETTDVDDGDGAGGGAEPDGTDEE
ncbi:molecular chaperone Hsp20 [Halobacteriales archaeon QS_5_70_15]|nr:MAG: molecular chaperone Hsp20 [Halobacteriales archaeon QS_5_70_15]